jgi:hypothetical protein
MTRVWVIIKVANVHELEEGLYSGNIAWLFMFYSHIRDANEMCFVGSKISNLLRAP